MTFDTFSTKFIGFFMENSDGATYCNTRESSSYDFERAAVEACYRTQSCIGISVVETGEKFSLISSADCLSTDGIFQEGHRLSKVLAGQ